MNFSDHEIYTTSSEEYSIIFYLAFDSSSPLRKLISTELIFLKMFCPVRSELTMCRSCNGIFIYTQLGEEAAAYKIYLFPRCSDYNSPQPELIQFYEVWR